MGPAARLLVSLVIQPRDMSLTLVHLLYGPNHVIHEILKISQRVCNRGSLVDGSKRSIEDCDNILEQFCRDTLSISTTGMTRARRLTSKIKASNPSFSLLFVHNFNSKLRSSNNQASSSSGPRSSSESSISAWACLYAL